MKIQVQQARLSSTDRGPHFAKPRRRSRVGQYRLITRLGAGGMGEVFLAEHRRLKRRFALKFIRRELAGNPRHVARFEQEARATARLTHENIVDVFDYGRTADGVLYYVMEYLPGVGLDELVERHGPLPAARVIHLLLQACAALRHAHEKGLVHRDVKPANLLVTRQGSRADVIKLVDFGLAQAEAGPARGRLQPDGAISGTPQFMSPEQARGLQTDARSDIYSLGAVAYFLLCGRPPFEGSNPIDVFIAHAHDEVIPPSKIRPGVPADLESIILRCLAKRPEDRFADAESLTRALASCAAAGQWTECDAAKWWDENPLSAEVCPSMRRELNPSTSPYTLPRLNSDFFPR